MVEAALLGFIFSFNVGEAALLTAQRWPEKELCGDWGLLGPMGLWGSGETDVGTWSKHIHTLHDSRVFPP